MFLKAIEHLEIWRNEQLSSGNVLVYDVLTLQDTVMNERKSRSVLSVLNDFWKT